MESMRRTFKMIMILSIPASIIVVLTVTSHL